ncbi:flavin reductase [Amycolatopsis sp. NPDC051372]|uniref:flavin reductase n=1 Tax=Amycolatopsis sp. NPDC051372 TaxID=3155669 RepID=UPI00342FD5A4
MSVHDQTAAADAGAPSIDPVRFREVLGTLPTAVCIATATSPEGSPIGMTIGSATSVSLDPPLVGFFAVRTSSTFAQIRAAGYFCLNVLAEPHEALCRTFAGPAAQRFDGVAWNPATSGAPVLDDAIARIHCRTSEVIETGDHFLMLGRVLDLDAPGDTVPLLFFRGGFGSFSSRSLVAQAQSDLTVQLATAEDCRGPMEQLSAELGLVATLSAAIDGHLVSLLATGPGDSVRSLPRVGRRMPITPPIGSLFVAWEDAEVIEHYLDSAEPALNPDERCEQRKLLTKIHERGWSFLPLHQAISRAEDLVARRHVTPLSHDEEHELHALLGEASRQTARHSDPDATSRAHGIAVPVFDGTGRVTSTISVLRPNSVLTATEVQAIAARMMTTAHEVATIANAGT